MMRNDLKPKLVLPRLLLAAAGCVLVGDTLFVLTRSGMNLGVIMPAIIGAPLIIIGLLLPGIVRLCSKSRIFKALMLAVSACYVIFCLLFCVTTVLIQKNSAPPEEPADVLIVLGCGIRGSSPTLTLRYRLDKTIEYLNDHTDTMVVVSGGQSFDEICSEASVMKAYLTARGIDENRILTEELSKSTEENFLYSKSIIDDNLGSGKRIAFVTTRFHVYRSELAAKKLGIEAEGIPAKGVWYITPNDYLRECAALTYYFLSGRI